MFGGGLSMAQDKAVFFITSVAELLQDEFSPRFDALKARAEELGQEIPEWDLLATARQIQVQASPEQVSGEDALERAYQQLKEEAHG
jgi:hypothetical protein